MTRLRGGHGFTLVELMIVVVIIGLLASIAVPSLRAASRRGHRAAVVADGRDLHAAMAGYYADHGEFPSAGLFDLTTLAPLSSTGHYEKGPSFVEKLWMGRILVYVPTSSGGSVADKYWILARSEGDPYTWILIAHSDDMPSWAPGWYDGVYVYDYETLRFVPPPEAAVVPW